MSTGTLALTNAQAIQNSAFNPSGAGTLGLTGINTPTFGGLTGSANYAAPANVTTLSLNPGAGFTKTYSGNLSGGTNMNLTVSGPGIQVFSGTNTYAGATNLQAGELSISSDANIGGAASAINFVGGGLQITGTTLTNLDTHSLNLTTFNGALDIAAAGNTFTLDQNLSGSGSLTKLGAGTMLVTGTNTFTGPLAINGGVLNFASSANLGAGTAINFGGGTLQYATGDTYDITARTVTLNAGGGGIDTNGNNITLANGIGGVGGLTKIGTGTLTLTGNSTFSGGAMISGGTVIGASGSLGTGRLNVGPSGALLVSQGPNFGLAGQYYNITANQANLATLALLQSSFGGTAPVLAVNTTSLNFGNSGSGFPAPYNSGGPVFESFYSGLINLGTGGTYTFNTSSDDGSMIYLDGAVVVTNNFGQAVTTRSGSIALTAGYHNIAIAYNNTGGGYGMNAQISGAGNTAMVDLTTANAQITPDLVIGSLSGSGSVALSTGNLIVGTDNTSSTFDGVISSSGAAAPILGLTKFGSGVLTLTNVNTYVGPTTIASGAVQLANANALTSSTVSVNANGGLTFATGINPTIGALAGTGNVTLTDAATNPVTLSAGGNNASTTYSGVLGGNGALSKSGSGTLTLSGANTYTGTTVINAGTLVLSRPGGIYHYSGGNLSINNGSTLRVANANQYWFDNKSFVFDSNGGGVLDTSTGVNFVVGTADAFTTSGGAQNTIIGGSGINLNGGTATFNVTRGSGTSDLKLTTILSNSGSIVATGSGILELTANNTFVGGGVTISGGATVTVATLANGGQASPLGASTSAASNLVLNNGTLQFTGSSVAATDRNFTISPSSAGTINVANAAAVVTASGAAAATTGTLVKTGPGALVLAGNNAQTGGLSVSGGTVRVNAVQSYGGATTIAAGSTLSLATPLTPVAGFSRRFDASNAASVSVSGGLVTQWNDLSGNGANATPQVPGTSNPTLTANALNGLSAIHFTGSGNNSTNLLFAEDANIRSTFSVFKGSSFLLTDTNAYNFHRPDDGNPASPLWAAGNASGNITGGSTYVNGTLVNGTSTNMPTASNNGFNLVEVLTTGSVASDGFNRDRIFHSGDQSQAEVLIYDTVLTTAQRLQNEAYLNYKWFGIGTGSTVVNNALPATTPVNLAGAGATLDLGGSTQTIGSLTASDSSTQVTLGGGALTTGNDNTDTTFAGLISGGGSLTKIGSGSFTLSGANTFAGGATLTSGTLASRIARDRLPAAEPSRSTAARLRAARRESAVTAPSAEPLQSPPAHMSPRAGSARSAR